MPDHYATLGVPPTAKTAAIRAAYLALMREYHPDRNGGPAAIARAQAVIAAFKVLGDFDQRNHYDWNRRREREAAEAAAAKRPRRIRAGTVGAGAIGLAAIGAMVLMPTATPGPLRSDRPVAEMRTAAVTKPKPVEAPSRVTVASAVEKTVTTPVRAAKPEPRAEPVRVASIEPVPPKPTKAIPAPILVRTVAVKAKTPRIVPAPLSPPPPTLAAARPVARRATTDLASLDQFVMNFYGQSWRYGTAPKRAALAKSRSNFVVRSGACVADACKREAYLKLMRDVSEIVETGQPKTR